MCEECIELWGRTNLDSLYIRNMTLVCYLFLLFVIFFLRIRCLVLFVFGFLIFDQYLACSAHEITIRFRQVFAFTQEMLCIRRFAVEQRGQTLGVRGRFCCLVLLVGCRNETLFGRRCVCDAVCGGRPNLLFTLLRLKACGAERLTRAVSFIFASSSRLSSARDIYGLRLAND